MRIVVAFLLSVPAKQRVGKQLLELVPETRDPMSSWIADLVVGDHRIIEVESILKEASVQRLTASSSRDVEASPLGYYLRYAFRRFTPEEHFSCDYLYLPGQTVQPFLDCHDRDATGELLVNSIRLPPRGTLFGFTDPIIAEHSFVPVIEAEHFSGMAFRPTKFAVTIDERDASGKPKLRMVQGRRNRQFAEIFPSIELPMMVAGEVMWAQSYAGQIVGPAGPGRIRNPGFDDFQPVYTRSALQSVGPFDIARTLEFRSEHCPENRMYIISQRFYRFLQHHEIEATCVPVKIIED